MPDIVIIISIISSLFNRFQLYFINLLIPQESVVLNVQFVLLLQVFLQLDVKAFKQY